MTLSLIVAVSENGIIGRGNGLPWHLSDDLKHFKRLTTGNTVIMGRKTWDSIGRPLPDRRNIVITRNMAFLAEGAEVFHELKEALRACGDSKVFVIGGSQLYAAAIHLADEIFLTRVHATVDGDVHMPDLDPDAWSVEEEFGHSASERNDHSFTIQHLVRS